MTELVFEEVMTWLQSKSADEFVGSPCIERSCPLSNYLRVRTHSMACWRVTSTSVIDPDEVETPLPVWAENFVTLVDECEKPQVCAAEAIEIMNQVEPYVAINIISQRSQPDERIAELEAENARLQSALKRCARAIATGSWLDRNPLNNGW